MAIVSPWEREEELSEIQGVHEGSPEDISACASAFVSAFDTDGVLLKPCLVEWIVGTEEAIR